MAPYSPSARDDVQSARNHAKRYLHPEAGPLAFDFTYLWFGRRSEIRMATLTPADGETSARLASSYDRFRVVTSE